MSILLGARRVSSRQAPLALMYRAESYARHSGCLPSMRWKQRPPTHLETPRTWRSRYADVPNPDSHSPVTHFETQTQRWYEAILAVTVLLSRPPTHSCKHSSRNFTVIQDEIFRGTSFGAIHRSHRARMTHHDFTQPPPLI